MNISIDINVLIENYFEGLTSLDEEQKLRDYFRQENIPQDLEIYKPMFQYFASERENCASLRERNPKGKLARHCESEARSNLPPLTPPKGDEQFPSFGWVRGGFWGSVSAAACLLLLISLRLFLNPGETFPEISQAYIDGKRYTDIELIRTETLKSLENLSEGSEDAYSSQIEALEIFTK